MPDELTLTIKIHFSMANKGKRQIKPGPDPIANTPDGRVPRVSRLMTLAIKFDRLIADGAIRDQAQLAELDYVTRARVTQVMNLFYYAPGQRCGHVNPGHLRQRARRCGRTWQHPAHRQRWDRGQAIHAGRCDDHPRLRSGWQPHRIGPGIEFQRLLRRLLVTHARDH